MSLVLSNSCSQYFDDKVTYSQQKVRSALTRASTTNINVSYYYTKKQFHHEIHKMRSVSQCVETKR